jgi:hypothetical protein
MNASARTARRILRDRTRTQRAASRIARRGTASLATHAIAQGLGPKAAASVASTLRKKTKELGLVGQTARVHAGGRMRTTTRYTPAQVALAAALYRPRIAAYKTVALRLALAA